MPARPVLDRFSEKVDMNGPGGCWVWTAGRDVLGYGRLKVDGRAALAHRVAYELFVGPIPEGLELDHRCRVRHCVNPAHLEPVTHVENVRRGESPAAQHARKEQCIRGHDLADAYIDGNGRRVCNACVRARRAVTA